MPGCKVDFLPPKVEFEGREHEANAMAMVFSPVPDHTAIARFQTRYGVITVRFDGAQQVEISSKAPLRIVAVGENHIKFV
jgi:hypothetical protein